MDTLLRFRAKYSYPVISRTRASFRHGACKRHASLCSRVKMTSPSRVSLFVFRASGVRSDTRTARSVSIRTRTCQNVGGRSESEMFFRRLNRTVSLLLEFFIQDEHSVEISLRFEDRTVRLFLNQSLFAVLQNSRRGSIEKVRFKIQKKSYPAFKLWHSRLHDQRFSRLPSSSVHDVNYITLTSQDTMPTRNNSLSLSHDTPTFDFVVQSRRLFERFFVRIQRFRLK